VDIGMAGSLMIFFSVLIAEILVSILVLAYAGYSFFLILCSTASGNDEIHWPGDPIQDWLFKGWYLLWLTAVGAVPAVFLAELMGLPARQFSFYLAVAGIIALIFPFNLLSSLSGESRLLVFRAVILRLMLKHIGTMVAFYLLSGALLAACVGLFYVAIMKIRLLLPVAAVAGAFAFFVYARLLGRTAWYIARPSRKRKKDRDDRPDEAEEVKSFDPWSIPQDELRTFEEPVPSRPQSSTEAPRPKKRKAKPKTKKPDSAYDPWAVPVEEFEAPAYESKAVAGSDDEDPLGPVKGAYNLADSNAPLRAPKPISAPLPQKSTSDDPYGRSEGSYDLQERDVPCEPQPRQELPNPNLQGYAVAPEVAGELSKAPEPVPVRVSKLEEELAAPRRQPIPKRLFMTGVYGFPFYPRSIAPLLTLALGLLGSAALLAALLALAPF
jgi:hypothetical protein